MYKKLHLQTRLLIRCVRNIAFEIYFVLFSVNRTCISHTKDFEKIIERDLCVRYSDSGSKSKDAMSK